MQDISFLDEDALCRAMVQTMTSREDGRREHIESMLVDRPWIEVARFAAYSCQRRALRLKPWQNPPCDGGIDPESEALLDRMLTASVSQWEPDPIAALAKVEAKA